MTKPAIIKLGTIDLDLVETTPVVFQGKLYRFEYVRPQYWANDTGDSYFRFVDHESGRPGAPFAQGYHLGNVMAEKDEMFVTATDTWDGEKVDIFASRDLEQWESWNALNLPGYGIFNTSVCKADGKYVLMFEIGRPEELAGQRFTALFAESPDMREWRPMPPECTYSKDRYTAPHCLRYLDGYYYNFYLEDLKGSYDQYVVRSRDLVSWEPSPLNPVLQASDEDKQIANQALTAEQRAHVANAVNINNSDIDFCEYRGRTIITYSWGDQKGTEHLAEAVFEGSEAEFLKGWFPDDSTRRAS